METNWFNYPDFYDFIAKIEGYRVFVEVGVFKGNSISYLADKLRHKEAMVFAVDLWEDTTQYKDNPELMEDVKILSLLYNKQLTKTNTRHLISDIKSESSEAAHVFQDDSVDFVFLDANHDHDWVKRDILAWLPKVRKGGIIAGHDATRPEVQQVLGEVFDNKVGIDMKSSVWHKLI